MIPRKPANLTAAERVALRDETRQKSVPLPPPDDNQIDLHCWFDESKLEQEKVLNLWEEQGPHPKSNKGEEYNLRQGWTPPTNEEMKGYIRWVIDSSGHDLFCP